LRSAPEIRDGRRVVRKLVLVLAFVLAAGGVLAIRVVVEGRSALADGEALLAAGQVPDAIRTFEASARWYLPLAPHVDDAYARLRELTGSKDPAVALLAWRAIRSASRATRSLWTPHADDAAAADRAIAQLSARHPEAATAGGSTVELRELWHSARLARDLRPSPGAAAIAALGILTWLAGFVWLVRRGVDERGVLVRRPALVAATTIVVGFVLWAAGLYNA
jgi:hypothetical protein